MAYINQETKNKLLPGIKEVLNRYGMRGTVSIHDYCCLCVTLQSGKLPLKGEYDRLYRNQCTGKAVKFFDELEEAMDKGNYDRSDVMSDYHEVGWYTSIYVGSSWKKPYIQIK